MQGKTLRTDKQSLTNIHCMLINLLILNPYLHTPQSSYLPWNKYWRVKSNKRKRERERDKKTSKFMSSEVETTFDKLSRKDDDSVAMENLKNFYVCYLKSPIKSRSGICWILSIWKKLYEKLPRLLINIKIVSFMSLSDS